MKNLKRFIKNKNGFTLIELIVVIAIIGILATMTISSFSGAQKRGRDARRKAEVNEIKAALEFYKIDQGFYPASFPACDAPLTGGPGPTTYIQKLPCDPKSGLTYVYNNLSPSTFTLAACLENVDDSEKDAIDTCAGSTVSYTLTNP